MWRNRWSRSLIWLGLGILMGVVAGLWWQPRWPSFCDRVTIGKACNPITALTSAGYITIFIGLFVMILGPIAATLTDLWRNGYDWESSRVETAISNIPILLGLLLMLSGLGMVAVG